MHNPYLGSPLGYAFLREKRLGGKRIYFLVYDIHKAALLVDFSDKKTQQDTIDLIKERLTEFDEVIKSALKQHV